MKVIFLDFDGVITTPPRWKLNPDKIKWIKKLVEETDAKIVVSSSWRHGINRNFDYEIEINPQNKEIINWLRNNIYDITPSGSSVRGKEIELWLIDHQDIENYIIIDDDGDMLDNQLFHFIQTDWQTGFTEREYELAYRVLNNLYIYSLIGLNFELRNKWRKKCEGDEQIWEDIIKYNDLKENNNEK